eukprot:1831441-Rhodomonas_salina.1
MVQAYLRVAGLLVSANCTKKRWMRSQCDACGRLFRGTHCFGGAFGPAGRPARAIDSDPISKALRSLLASTGVEVSVYTPVSMRQGGISTAISANVPEEVRKLQSGH